MSKISTEIADEVRKKEFIYENRLLDEQCKKILSNEQILSYFIKEFIPEYKDINIKDISKYIKKEPRYMNIEDVSVSGAKVIYDVLTEIKVPGKEDDESIGIILNVEAQNRDTPGYEIVSRGLYYCSRLISK